MGWGSNAGYAMMKCPYCGRGHIDDAAEGETTHMKACSWRTPWRAFMWKYFGRRFT